MDEDEDLGFRVTQTSYGAIETIQFPEVPKNPIKKKETNDLYAPPDGGWGWVVIIASFLCNLVLDGIAYVFGIFLVPMMTDYRVSEGPIATVGSILAGTIQLTGPFAAILVER